MALIAGDQLWVSVGGIGFLGLSLGVVGFCFVFLGNGMRNLAHIVLSLAPSKHEPLLVSLLSDVKLDQFLNLSSVSVAAVFVALVALVCTVDVVLTYVRESIREGSKAPTEEFITYANMSYDTAFANAAAAKSSTKRM